MTSRRRRLFEDMTPVKWANLVVAGLFVFYVAQIALDTAWQTMCGHIGVDYCDYWSAGRIANTTGYAGVYDLQRLTQVEKSIFPASADPSLFITSPFAYLPVFILPFQILALLPPEAGFGIWTLINVVALIVYLRFFGKELNGREPPRRMIVLLLACLPMFLNVFYGQVDVWLTVCVGEFVRALAAGRPLRGGLWLGGLLLKPQVLIVVGMVLLVQRALKVLAGLATSAAIVLGTSVLMLGQEGFIRMTSVWLRFAAGLPSQETESMMNWRMLGQHLSQLTVPWIGWGFAGAGMLVTLLVTLYVWRRPFDPHSPTFSVGILGTLAASLIVAWHSHVHVALMLLPPMLDLRQKSLLPEKVVANWVVLPAILFVAALFPESLMRLNVLPDAARHIVYFLRGVGEFAVSLYVLVWATVQSRRAVEAP